jgi:hypothetical protein
MSEISFLSNMLKDYFRTNFDLSLLSGKISPFIGLTYIKINPGQNHEFASSFFFVSVPTPTLPANDNSLVLLQQSNYLCLQYLKGMLENQGTLQNENGFAIGIPVNEFDALIVTIISDPEDYNFLFKSILNQLIIITQPNNPKP